MVSKLLELVDILHLALAGCDLIEYLKQSLGTYTARSTLTAGLVNGELKVELGDIHHTGILVHNDKSARAHHRAKSYEVIIVDRSVDILSRDTSAGRTACLCSLELLAVWYAAADLLDNFTQGSTHRYLNKTYVCDLTAQSEYLCTL